MKSSWLPVVSLLAPAFLAACASTQPYQTSRSITSIAFSPGGNRLAVANADEIRVLELESRKLLRTLREVPQDAKSDDPQQHRHGVGGSMVFLDDAHIVTTGMGGFLSTWDIDSGRRLALIEPLSEEEFASTLDYSAAAARLVIGTSTGRILIADLHGNETGPLAPVAELGGYVWDLQFSRDGRYFASAALVTRESPDVAASGLQKNASSPVKLDETASPGTYDQVSDQPEQSNVFIWDAESLEEVGNLKGAAKVYRMSLVPGEPALLTAGEDVQVWEFLTRRQSEQISDPSMVLQAIGFGTFAVVSVATLSMGVLSPMAFANNALSANMMIPNSAFIRHACTRAAAISPDARTIVSTTWGPNHNVMSVIDRAENKVVEKWTADGSVCDMQFSPDGKYLVTATSRGALIYDTATWKKKDLGKWATESGQ